MPRVSRSLLTCLVLLVGSCSLWSQQYGRIVGEVHVNRGDFPGRIFLELVLRGAPITSVYTDEQGKFEFPMLESNQYHLVIRDQRFYPLDERVVLDLGITATLMVQLHLTFKEEAKKESLPNRGPGSNPNMVDPDEYRRHVPRSALKEFDKGVKADRDGKADDAIKHYEKALTTAPDFYPAHNNLGSAYLNQRDFEAARTHFEEAIRLNQSDPQARLNLGNVFLQTKQFDEALKNVEEGLRRQPNSSLGLFLLGSIYEGMGRFQEAERTMRKALDADPSMSRIHLELVNLYLAQRKTLEATAELRMFLKDFPNDPMAERAKEVLKKLEN